MMVCMYGMLSLRLHGRPHDLSYFEAFIILLHLVCHSELNPECLLRREAPVGEVALKLVRWSVDSERTLHAHLVQHFL